MLEKELLLHLMNRKQKYQMKKYQQLFKKHLFDSINTATLSEPITVLQ